MSDVLTDLTETGAAANALILNIFQMELAKRSVLLPTVRDFSSWVSPGMKSVAVPRLSSYTAALKTENTALEYTAGTAAVDSIVFGQPYGVTELIADASLYQTVPAYRARILSGHINGIISAIEALVAAKLVKAANDHQLTGASNLVLTKADIIKAVELMDIANVPRDDRFLAITPAQQSAMLAIADFVKANEYGNSGAIQNGVLGNIFGLQVVVSNSFASASEFVAYHKDHVGFAMAYGPKQETQRIAKHLSDEITTSALFGAVQMNGGSLGVYADETAVA